MRKHQNIKSKANGVGFHLKTVGNMHFAAYFDRNRMIAVALWNISRGHGKKIVFTQFSMAQ